VSLSRRTGTAWETAIVDYLRGRGWPHAERRALAGHLDRGDIAGVVGVVIEAKAVKTVELAAFLDEAHIEAANDRADLGVVWLKRRGRSSPADGYVVMDGATFTRLLTDAGYGGGTLVDAEGAS
jgi:hypothetical protein